MSVTGRKALSLFVIPALLAVLFSFVGVGISEQNVAHAATNKAATKCLGPAAFPLDDLCVTVNYTVYSSTNEQISSVVECTGVVGPAMTAASIATEVDIYSGGPKVWSQRGSVLMYGPTFGASSTKCVWFWPWKSVKPGKVGVWAAAWGQIWRSPKNEPELVSPVWVGASNFS